MMKSNNEPEKPVNTFSRVDFGDGGYARIDQTAVDTTNVVMYHTYFNQTNNLLGFGRISSTVCAYEGDWAFKGFGAGAFTNECGDTEATNGILAADAVNFYAPVELGPTVVGSIGNTVYYGSDKLYRSINKGDLMTAVSQTLVAAVPVSTIAISPQDDNYRFVGLNNGTVWGTPTSPTTFTNITPVGAPARGVGKGHLRPDQQGRCLCLLRRSGNHREPAHLEDHELRYRRSDLDRDGQRHPGCSGKCFGG